MGDAMVFPRREPSQDHKTMQSGAYKAFGYAKYADRYLGAFAYRFNRRFDLANLVVRLIVDVSRSNAHA